VINRTSPADGDGGRALMQQRFAAGDEQALTEWHGRLRGQLIACARRYTGADDAEDVVQTALLDAWRRRDHYDPSRPLEAWLITIVRRRAIDHVRKQRLPTATAPYPLDLGDDLAPDADQLDQALDIRRALAQLPEPQRDALVRAYYTGLTQTEVARSVGTPIGTVKTRTARGMRRLAELLGERTGPLTPQPAGSTRHDR